MGGAFVGLADDVNSVFLNPAGLAHMDQPEVFFTYGRWIEDINNNHLAGCMPFGRNVLGIGINQLQVTGIEWTDADGNPKPGSDVSETFITAGYAFKISGNVGIGLAVKGISQKYGDNYSGGGFALDLSAHSKGGSLSFGGAVQNLGPPVQISGGLNDLPMTIKLGTAVKFIRDGVAVIDVEKPAETDVKFAIGAEYIIEGLFAVRAGYGQIDKFSTLRGWTAGFGSRTSLERKFGMDDMSAPEEGDSQVYLDYAIGYFGEELGYVHRVTLGVKFGKAR